MSSGSVSSAEASILSFSQRCGSGVNGASPSVRHSTIRIDRGIRLNKLRIVDINGVSGDFSSLNYLAKITILLERNYKLNSFRLHIRF